MARVQQLRHSFNAPFYGNATFSKPRLVYSSALRFSGAPGYNVLWVTAERPSRKGGLGSVSVSSVAAVNKNSPYEIRTLQPDFTRYPSEDHDNYEHFQDTGYRINYQFGDGQSEPVDLYQRYEPQNKTTAYALHNEPFFHYTHIYFPQDFKPETAEQRRTLGSGPNAIFNANMALSRLTREVAGILSHPEQLPEGVSKTRTSQLDPFKPDVIVTHDWLTGPAANQVQEDDHPVAKVFVLHNVYDQIRDMQTARQQGIQPLDPRKRKFSPLAEGIRGADVVMVDPHYVESLVNSSGAKPPDYIQALREKLALGRVLPLHHTINQSLDPVDNKLLDGDFRPFSSKVPLSPKSPEEEARLRDAIAQWKSVNRSALQKKYGLNGDPDAVIYSWAARFDPFQKGSLMVVDTLKAFLLTHEHAQVVFSCGKTGHAPFDQKLQAFLDEMKNCPELKGRFVHLGWITPQEIEQLYAGSDFTMLPSLYEPYGLTQLEAMMNWDVPLVQGVDGLKTTVRDPDVVQPTQHSPEEQYGQTGVFMQTLPDLKAYSTALGHLFAGKLKPSDAKVIQEADGLFMQGLERAYDLAQHPSQLLDVREKGGRYVREQHSPERISRYFVTAFDQAKVIAQKRFNAFKQQSQA